MMMVNDAVNEKGIRETVGRGGSRRDDVYILWEIFSNAAQAN